MLNFIKPSGISYSENSLSNKPATSYIQMGQSASFNSNYIALVPVFLGIYIADKAAAPEICLSCLVTSLLDGSANSRSCITFIFLAKIYIR